MAKLLTFRTQTLLPALFFLCLSANVFSQTENCTNGLDDDGDGKIDCYDQDCTCTGQCDDFYYTTCNADCFYIPPCQNLQLGVQWTSTAETGTYANLVAGDLDADGVPEIVSYRCEGSEIYIIEGKTGATKRTIIGPTIYPGGTSPAIADLDRDGFGEIVMVGNDRILRCWNHDGSLAWESSQQVGFEYRHRFAVPAIADFDHDGWAEILIANSVFNGQTGALLAAGGSGFSTGEHPARIPVGVSFAQSVAMDVLPDNFCADCSGLEIVAGNQVLSVNLQTGVVALATAAPAAYSDGYTSIADFDRDGDLDAIVQGKKGANHFIYVWEMESPTILREFQLLNNHNDAASRANVADLDGDGELEVSFVGYPWLYVLENNFTQKWIRPTTDASSVTTCSVFDFCGDGSADIIYRSETHLQVLEGATGQVKWQDDCVSATHIEAPLVLDVDADGQTEIVISCGTNGSKNFGTVSCYEAVGAPGIASRKVWNQHAYFNTNINDDLSVPRFQQNPSLVGDGLELNSFLNQFFNPTFPSPDGALTLQNVGCLRDSLLLILDLCNPGDNLLPANTPLTFYKKNPTRTAATRITTVPLGFQLAKDSCRSFFLTIPRVANDSVFLVLNDDGSRPTPFNFSKDFPVTTIGECSFGNNMVSFFYKYAPPVLNLGKDTAICDNTVLPLDAAGVDYSTWIWQDGSTQPSFVAPDAGTFSVTITDVCGITQTDTRIVKIDSSTIVNIGADQAICLGEKFQLEESGFDFYTWKPALFLNCTSCPKVSVAAPFSGFVILEAGFNNGCRNLDSVFVNVRDTFFHKFDTTVCFGKKVVWNSVKIAPGGQEIFKLKTKFGCDSTVQVNVQGTTVGTYDYDVNVSICKGKSFIFNSLELLPGENKIFNLTASTGCDSTIRVHVAPLDTFWTAEKLDICEGKTVPIFGQQIGTAGFYKKLFAAKNGCDSTHTVDLTVLPGVKIEFDASPTCLGLSDGTLLALPSGGRPPFEFEWNLAGETKAKIEDLPAGNYQLTVTDANDCSATAAAAVENFPPIQLAVETDSVRCHGEKNGSILLASPDSTLQISLDDELQGQVFEFKNLPAGKYSLRAEDQFGCVVEENVEIFQPDPLWILLPQDTSLELGDSLRLDLQSNATTPLTLRWLSPKYLTCDTCSAGATIAKPLATFRYVLTATDANGCRASDEILVQVQRFVNVFVPNVFSSDATLDANSRLQAFFGKAIAQVEFFRIFDRWGTLLHEVTDALPNDDSTAWDGRHKGKLVAPGVVVWKMKVRLLDGSFEVLHGTVAVVR